MKRIFIPLLIVAGIVSCREQYDPKVKSLQQSFLVVEGNLNVSHDSTIVRLTRTFKLEDTAKLKVENGAQLTVEGSDNTIRPLTARGNGYYVSPDLNLVVNTQYRLRIKTSDGKEYLSGFVKARTTPPIDSISWENSNEGVRVFANTKDPSNASRYYRWDYDETWEIHSFFYSDIIYQNGSIRNRVMPAEDVSVCWKYASSTNIPLANSVRLQDDIISRALLTLITPGNERLSVRYSILVKQYALDKEAYEFFELMKKNTEEIGSIFSPQPSEIKGNIQCLTDPSQYVLGYITASAVQTKRIFIRVSPWNFREDCPSFKVAANPDSIRFYFGTIGYIPYSFNFPAEYFGGYPNCVDCTTRGGSTKKPSYW